VIDILNIEDIRRLYEHKSVVLTEHFLERIEKRSIKLTDVKNTVMNGEIIEHYPDDYPHPSCLILGKSDTLSLHIVLGSDDVTVWLITAYYPNTDKWEDDFRTRKVKE
jgi:hypothetical protein